MSPSMHSQQFKKANDATRENKKTKLPNQLPHAAEGVLNSYCPQKLLY